MKASDLIRQPLVHFFALGAVLFLVFQFVDRESGANPGAIVVDTDRVAALVTRFRRTWQRPPTQAELEGLVDSWIREEVLYREGLSLGLDRDDPIVRRRVAQKFEFMFEGNATPPGNDELHDWINAHPERYRVPARYAFEQVYFNPEKHGEQLEEVVQQALATLHDGGDAATGDLTLLPDRIELAGAPEIERSFGAEFAAGLEGQPTGVWVGPLRSSFGLHLVRLEESEGSYLPELDVVRAAVERDLLQDKSDKAKEDLYRALRDRYEIRIEATPDLAALPDSD